MVVFLERLRYFGLCIQISKKMKNKVKNSQNLFYFLFLRLSQLKLNIIKTSQKYGTTDFKHKA